MDMNQLFMALGLQQAYQAYQENIGEPFAAVVGGGGRGYLGLDQPSYGGLLSQEAYKTGQALGTIPGIGAPAGAFKAAAQAPEMFGLLGSVAPKIGSKISGLLDYQGTHKPPAPDYGAPLSDLTKILPKNVYTRQGKDLYGQGDPVVDREWWMAAMKAKNNPNFEVEIYRAVPKGVKDINSGDWVTTSKKYAEMHGENALSGDYEIISKKVKAKNLYTAGDPQEYGFFD